jgi:hypothetical protein
MDRIGYIGGSDAMRIMAGDWVNLYLEKTGAKQPEDLSGNFQVQLGKHTEEFHIDWVMNKLGYSYSMPKDTWKSNKYFYMQGHFDAWIHELQTFIEVKHSNEWMSASDKARYYMPQLQHYLYISECPFCYFSVIRGNQDPEYVTVKADDEYQAQLIERIKLFWWHIENKTAPIGDEVPVSEQEADRKLAEKVPVNNLKKIDMTKNNQWAVYAKQYIETASYVDQHEEAKKALKELVTPNIGEAYGHGVTIKRDKRGSLRFTTKGEDE